MIDDFQNHSSKKGFGDRSHQGRNLKDREKLLTQNLIVRVTTYGIYIKIIKFK